MENETLKRSEKFLRTLDDVPTKEEFVRLFEAIISALKKMDEQLNSVADSIQQDTSKTLTDLKGQVDTVFVGDKMSEMRKEIDSAIRRLDSKINSVRDGKPGERGEPGLHGKPGRNGKDGSPDTPNQIISKINRADDKIEIEQIQGLKDLIEKLDKPRLGGGGGASAVAIKFALGRITKNETPTGDIDGVNTDYTVTQPINAILSFAINGQFITDDEYSFTGRTITMNTAIPSALSGKSFRISYI